VSFSVVDIFVGKEVVTARWNSRSFGRGEDVEFLELRDLRLEGIKL
jgi:hypothetical protein